MRLFSEHPFPPEIRQQLKENQWLSAVHQISRQWCEKLMDRLIEPFFEGRQDPQERGQVQGLVRFCYLCSEHRLEETFRDYLRIKEAARLLGISEATLRNWCKQGKIKVHRNPVNGYRLFKKGDLDELLLAVKRS